MKVSAKLNNLRVAPRKSKLVADMIRGLDAFDAIRQLEVTVKRSGLPIKKLLESAVSNAENNFGLDKNNLYVFDAVVGAGPTYKRWMPRAHGRASKILKRTSKITVVLEERIEGKNRKTKEQMEKERRQKEETRRKEENEKRKERKEKEKIAKSEKGESKVSEERKPVREDKKDVKKEIKKTWASKIFRRKSM